MAGFGRREIEYMQDLCIYNKYTECYSVRIQYLVTGGADGFVVVLVGVVVPDRTLVAHSA